jgi:hypothetical protein
MLGGLKKQRLVISPRWAPTWWPPIGLSELNFLESIGNTSTKGTAPLSRRDSSYASLCGACAITCRYRLG